MSILDRVQKGRVKRPMLNLIYGAEKVGKSEFAAQFPSPITITFDDGMSMIDTNSVLANDWNDTLGILYELHSMNMDHGYQTINIDPLGWAEEMCVRQMCLENNVETMSDDALSYGKGKDKLTTEFQRMIDWVKALHSQGMHVNYVAHSKIYTYKDPSGADYDKFTVLMRSKEMAERMKQAVDNVLYIEFDSKGVEEKIGGRKMIKGSGTGRRIMRTRASAVHEGGNRIGLPASIELSPTPEAGFKTFWEHYKAWDSSVGTDYEQAETTETQETE